MCLQKLRVDLVLVPCERFAQPAAGGRTRYRARRPGTTVKGGLILLDDIGVAVVFVLYLLLQRAPGVVKRSGYLDRQAADTSDVVVSGRDRLNQASGAVENKSLRFQPCGGTPHLKLAKCTGEPVCTGVLRGSPIRRRDCISQGPCGRDGCVCIFPMLFIGLSRRTRVRRRVGAGHRRKENVAYRDG